VTISSLLSSEQITAIKDQFAAVEITDADFKRIEVIGDLIRHIEIVDNERRQHETKVERLAQGSLFSLEPR
jgi:acyl carrier protein